MMTMATTPGMTKADATVSPRLVLEKNTPPLDPRGGILWRPELILAARMREV